MQKKWLIIILIIALLVITISGVYVFIDRFFPKAETIKCPNIESIIAISLSQNNDISVMVETAKFGEFLQNIKNAQPTRIMSVNDYPTATNYYTIEINTSEREYQYYIYGENSEVYIEIPYEGIYKSKQQFLNFVIEYFKK